MRPPGAAGACGHVVVSVTCARCMLDMCAMLQTPAGQSEAAFAVLAYLYSDRLEAAPGMRARCVCCDVMCASVHTIMCVTCAVWCRVAPYSRAYVEAALSVLALADRLELSQVCVLSVCLSVCVSDCLTRTAESRVQHDDRGVL
jgi:hypothetical protein